MEKFRYGASIAGLTLIQDVDIEALKDQGFFIEFVTETEKIAVYYAVNGWLKISCQTPETQYEEDTTMGYGQLLIRIKNSQHSDVLWSVAIVSHGSLYRSVNELLANQQHLIHLYSSGEFCSTWSEFHATAEKYRLEHYIIAPYIMEGKQYAHLPDEDDENKQNEAIHGESA